MKYLTEVFNPQTPDHPDVTYFSFAGRKKLSHLHPLYLFQQVLDTNGQAGENDGLVTVESSRWGEFVDILPLDHAEMINWSIQYDARILFRDLVNFLSSRGF
jgi:triacylglycerol lipase